MRALRNNRRARAMQMMASRIANIALPSRGYDIFAKIREKQFKRWGNYGLANDPRQRMMPPDQYLSGNIPALPTQVDMDTIHKKNTFNTRAEIAQRELGMSNMSMSPLINIANMAPRQGVASARGQSAMVPEDEMVPHGTPVGYGYQAQPNRPLAAGNPRVEDQGWSQSLAQIVGSGMLSQEQLQAASYSNMLSMIRIDGGSEADRQEMAYMLQRMTLEGYARGVDLVRDIKNEYGGSFRIQLTDGAVCSDYSTGIIGCGGMGYVQFRNSYWQGASDANKLSLFYHELGHELLSSPHRMGQQSLMSYTYGFGGTPWTQDPLYNSLVNELFNNGSGVTRFNVGSVPKATQEQVNAWLANEQLPPTTVSPNNPNSPPTTTTTVSEMYSPSSGLVNSSYLGNPTQIGNSPAQTPEDVDKTPVAGSLPDMASVQSFAAGLAATTAAATPMLNNLGSALMRLKAG